MNRILIISLIAICVVLTCLLQCAHKNIDKLKDYKSMYEGEQDTLNKIVDKLGRETTTTTLLYGQIDEFKKLVSTKDSSLRKLQAIVNKNTITATIKGIIFLLKKNLNENLGRLNDSPNFIKKCKSIPAYASIKCNGFKPAICKSMLLVK